MDNDGGRRWLWRRDGGGGLLLLLWTLILLGQALDLGRRGWPVFVIVPGLGLLGLGLAAPGPAGRGAGHGRRRGHHGRAGSAGPERHRPLRDLDHAWTLVLVAGAGISRLLVGITRSRRDLVASGGWLICAGLAGFLSCGFCSRWSSGSTPLQ